MYYKLGRIGCFAILALAGIAKSGELKNTPRFLSNGTSGVSITTQAVKISGAESRAVPISYVQTQAIQPPTGPQSTALPAALAQPARVIVRLQSQVAQSFSLSLSSTSGAANIASAASVSPSLGDLLAKHRVRAAFPLLKSHLRVQTQQNITEASFTNTLRQRFSMRTGRAPKNVVTPDLSSTYVFDLENRTAEELGDTLRSLRADPKVIYAEEDKSVQTCYTPNDPSYSSTGSWGQNYDDLHGLKAIGAGQAWDFTKGLGVVVAVVDTGIDYNHPDISANVWVNTGEIPGNGIDDDGNGFVDDVRGWDFVGSNSSQPAEDNDPFDGYMHGTHVAGTIAATGNNGVGVVGVAWMAKVMAVKALDDSGNGYDSDLARAIIYAADNGADVINASWGGAGFSQTTTDAVNYARSLGVVFVAAAGNSSSDAKDFSPASIPGVITVSSLDPFGNLSYFSNFGSKIDVAAPGEDILSLQAGTTGYVRLSGTSMAAPHVSGVAALIIARHPTWSNEEVRQALRVSATDLGLPGKDPSFGYGRVNAAQGVIVTQVLAAKILSPNDGTPISGITTLLGTAAGSGFSHYVVDFGAGATPGAWTTLTNSNTGVTNGSIGAFDPSALADGIYTVRLRAFNTNGNIFTDQIQIQVRYLEITAPLPPKVPSFTNEVKPGSTLVIRGSARGASFQSYRLEWAPGVAATSGWSVTGVTLNGSGSVPVTDGVLGSWTPPNNSSGYYTIRLTVTNSGFSSSTSSLVYAEPSLISSGFPVFVGSPHYDQSAVPVRQPDGTTRLVLCGTYPPLALYSYGADGSVTTAPIDYGSYTQPAAGNLDGQPGDEVVVADGYAIKIFSSDLKLIRTIPSPSGLFLAADTLVLTDLDNDGVPEIIALGRNPDQQTGEIYVFRADGTRFSNIPAPSFSTYWADTVKLAAIDLNADGRKEIVVAAENIDRTGYTVTVFNAEGSPYPGWSPLSFPDRELLSVSGADLDHDGLPEIVIGEVSQVDANGRVLVLTHTGAVRPGWPVIVDGNLGNVQIAIGDLDHDHRLEIVVATNYHISVLGADGTLLTPPWPIEGDGPFNVLTTPLIADVDGDGFPEILLGLGTYDHAGPTYYRGASLTCYHRDGTVQHRWQLFGAAGQQPFTVTPVVGDFNGDGRTDVGAHIGLIQGGESGGTLINTALTILTTGANFTAASSDWTSNFHDAQNSSTANAAPMITTQPLSQTIAGGDTVVFTCAAGGNPIPSFQWKKGGLVISGATKSSFMINTSVLGDAGNYTVTVTNSVDSATSSQATLTVLPVLPSFTTQPASQAVTLGHPVNFTAVAGGMPAPTYQWKKAGVNISGATSNSYAIASAAASDAGNYTVVATNVAGSATSSVARLMVNVAPAFTTQPASQTIVGGSPVTFTAAASGTPTPTFQWKKGGVAISGATSSAYTIASVAPGDAGSYTAVATNSVSAATSNAAILTVNLPPAFTTQPATQTIVVGSPVTFTAAVSGTPTPTFQWKKGGVAISGATSSAYTIASVAASDAGSYTVVATNSVTAVTSNPAALTVNSVPAIPVFTLQPLNKSCIVGGSLVLTVAASGTPSPTFQWMKNGVPINGAIGATFMIGKVVAGDAGSYAAVATNAGGSVTSDPAIVTVDPQSVAPTITQQPTSQSVIASNPVVFTVVANGVPAPTFQWLRNSFVIQGAVSATYSIANASPADAGTYKVIVTNIAGSVISAEATLTVTGSGTSPGKILGDFDGDRKADILWSNGVTGDRSMWFLNGNTMSGGATLGLVPVGWAVSATVDFDGDGKADIFWTNTVTGDRAIWLMNGSTMRTNTFMGTVPVDWVISGAGDFNGDGKADLVWTNTTTGDRAMWLMNGTTVLGGGYLGTVPVAWTISGVGDFNGDGKADLVWSNTVTGEHSMWFQNGSTTIAGATLNTVPPAWAISGVGDFNGDGKADIFLSNTTTGDRVIWLMNGSTITTNAFMGTVPVEWEISGTGDFNGDKKKDLFWTNTANGDRAMWLLNGSTVLGGGYMGTVPVEWKIN